MAKVLEIEFKGGRKAFYANPQEFPFRVGDPVIVAAEKGEGLGVVINLGSLVDQRAGDQPLPHILRKPNKDDFAHQEENEKLEAEAFDDCKKRIEGHNLDMKLVDVEYQFDRKKITFYFTSENRVDFRALVRDLASRYRTRIELRQIGVRDEAKRIGGMGVCGRKLCCSSFLREFEPVVTQLAKDQNLALNPTKLSGSCGRLMCCLRYEQEMYLAANKRFPNIGTPIRTEQGTGKVIKFDMFKDTVTLIYESQEQVTLTLEQLEELKSGVKAPEKDRNKDRDRNKGRDRGRDRDRNKEKDRDGAPEKERESEKGKDRDKNRDRGRGRDRGRNRDNRDQTKAPERVQEPGPGKESDKDKDNKNRDRRRKNRRRFKKKPKDAKPNETPQTPGH